LRLPSGVGSEAGVPVALASVAGKAGCMRCNGWASSPHSSRCTGLINAGCVRARTLAGHARCKRFSLNHNFCCAQPLKAALSRSRP
jgi:hypothetical protein